MKKRDSVQRFWHPNCYIDKKWRDEKPVGYCYCDAHRGYLSAKLVKSHKCVERRCRWLQRYQQHPFWTQKKKERRNE